LSGFTKSLLIALLLGAPAAQTSKAVAQSEPFAAAAKAEAGEPKIAGNTFLPNRALPAVVTILVTKKANEAVSATCSMDATTTSAEVLGLVDEVMRVEAGPTPLLHQRATSRQALGSGFLVDASGFIVTSDHLVRRAAAIVVRLHDGTEHTAGISGRDPKTDLALLKVDVAAPLPYLDWGDSGRTGPGDWILALGSPFGLADAVRIARVAAVGRVLGLSSYDDFLQINGAIGPGDGGGPNLDLSGRVIGVNTLMYAPRSRSVGIAFATPSDLARLVIDQLRAHGTVARSWLGAAAQDVTPAIAHRLGLPKAEGAIVTEVVEGSPAARAGLKQGDVIVALNRHDLLTARSLPLLVANLPIGSVVTLRIRRAGHHAIVQVATVPMPRDPEDLTSAPGASSHQARALGVTLSTLGKYARRQYRLPHGAAGVVVTGIMSNSPLASEGLAPCDVIETIDRQAVATPQQAARRFNEAARIADRRPPLLLSINRRGIRRFLTVSVRSRRQHCCTGDSLDPRGLQISTSTPGP